MDEAKVRQIKIKTGVVTRLVKEKLFYEEEFEKLKNKLATLRQDNSDSALITRQESMLEETRQMLPDCFRRLKGAVEELEKLIGNENGNESSEFLGEARSTVESGRKSLAC